MQPCTVLPSLAKCESHHSSLVVQTLSLTLTRSGRNPLLAFMPPVEIQWDTAKKILPVALLHLAMLLSTNACLFYSDLSFFPTARLLTVPLTAGYLYFLTRKKPSQNCLAALGVLLGAYLLAVVTMSSFSVATVFLGVLSCGFLTLYSTSVRSVIDDLNDNQW